MKAPTPLGNAQNIGRNGAEKVSTTHVVAGSITGAGLVANRGKVNWGTWKNMAVAWVLTLPGSAGLALITYLVLVRFLVPRLG